MLERVKTAHSFRLMNFLSLFEKHGCCGSIAVRHHWSICCRSRLTGHATTSAPGAAFIGASR